MLFDMEIKEWLSLITVLGCTLIGSLCLVNTPKKVRDLACESLGCFVMVFVHSFSYFIFDPTFFFFSSSLFSLHSSKELLLSEFATKKCVVVYLLPRYSTRCGLLDLEPVWEGTN